MKKILFVYTKMVLGGSTTSLLALLNDLDYARYRVDLLLYEKGGDLYEMIPKHVNITEQGKKYEKGSIVFFIKRLLSPSYVIAYLLSRIIARIKKNPLIKQQIMSYQSVRFCRKHRGNYDIAVGYLEFWPSIYIAKRIMAKKKISWIHIDYKSTGLVPGFDRKCFGKFDNIVLVSKECLVNFQYLFPELKNKAVCIENMISKNFLARRASEFESDLETDRSKLNLLTACRIVFSHKGLDRGVRAVKKLSDEGYSQRISWYIIGEGNDYDALKRMISEYGLDDIICLLGKKINPFPYYSDMDLFFLPSLYEGKPMAVTEAMMLGIPAAVTEYASAKEQIEHGVDGMIFDNNEEAVYKGLKMIIDHPEIILSLKKNVNSRDYSNIDEINKIYDLFEESGDRGV